MKELGVGILILLGAVLVTPLIWSSGIVYSIIYAFYMSITLKRWQAFFVIWWDILDGFAAAIGYILYQTGFGLDLTWNTVGGEMFEDIVTDREITLFRKKNITISEAIGKEEVEEKIKDGGKKLSKTLSFVFRQKRHAHDAYHYGKEKKRLRSLYFK